MTITKYIGMAVHKESISIAVMNSAGKFVMECVIETKGSMPVLEQVRKLSDALGTGLPPENFQVVRIERMPNSEAFADVVICNSVLHFARDDNHFRAMLAELWRVLRPGGMLFCRLGSRIGMEFE